ncbi:MAG: 30S ribosomal protein S4e [Candidatus Methanomethylophilaceae archaeon]|jgi:small subunit ribosomal protein S4e
MSDHMKRLAAPRAWPIKKKASVWIAKPSPGAHSVESAMPATVVLRDVIGVCDTAREAKRIIGNREVLVGGVPVKHPNTPIGLMDVVSIPKMDMHYRILLTDKGKLTALKIDADQSEWTLCRVEGKSIVKGGKFQIQLSGGRNVLSDKNDYKTGDTVKLNFAENKIMDHYALAEGATALIIEGNHAGKTATVLEYVTTVGSGANMVRFQSGTETVKKNVFIIGGSSAAITIPEATE